MSINDKHRIDIAVGGSHRGKVNNKTTTLRKLKEKLSDPSVDNSITYGQYAAMTVDEKGKRKAQAGYIMPGHFRDGIRKLSHQLFRSMVALDLDNITHDQLDLIRMGLSPLQRFYWFMHTTRSHSPEKPRVRIYLPLSRNVDADEAYALVRLVSLLLAEDPEEAIEIPDLVSFRFNQVMYLPSVSRGQEFWTDENPNAPVIDVDEFLGENPGWEDLGTLPRQKAEKEGRATDPNAKAEDPREKQGLIGAFCRAYTVEEAIAEFLSDIYVPGESSTETRYTFAGGTASNGAVVYDDGLFLHSHHGSDPAEGLHNAWDLVRLHLFGHKDDDAKSDTSPTNMPSFKAMREMVEKDDRTVEALSSHLLDSFDEDDEGYEDEEDEIEDAEITSDEDDSPEFDDAYDEDEDPDLADLIGDYEKPKAEKPQAKPEKKKHDLSWTTGFRRKANEDLEPVLHNAALICRNDPRIADAVAYNELTFDPVALKPIRSKKIPTPSQPVKKHLGFRGWEDSDDVAIQLIFSAPADLGGWAFDPSKANVQSAVLAAARQRSFHPIQDKVKEFHAAWIAAGRPTGLIEKLAQTYLGCPDDAFHRESSAMLMLALIARSFEPGCKFDVVTIIRGNQGGGKSTFWRVLALDDFFGELPKDFDKTDRMIEAMRGKLILEMGEMAGLRRETAEIAKEFITRNTDRHRLAYASREQDFPRQCILVGTSNLEAILHDPTGNRRFWIWVDTHDESNQIDSGKLEKMLPLLYGEAYQRYLDIRAADPTGKLHLDLRSPEALAGRNKLNDKYRAAVAAEVIAERVAEWLDTPISERQIEDADTDRFDADEKERMYRRDYVTVEQAMAALEHDTIIKKYTRATHVVFGEGMKLMPGWVFLDQCRRHGKKARWYQRIGSGREMFSPVPDDDDLSDLI